MECKQTIVSQNAYIADHCGLHALDVTNLNVVASNLLMTCFKSQSLPNSIIFITERHLHMFLTLCSQLRFTKLRRRSYEDLFEPDNRFQRRKVPDRLWTLKMTYINVETNNFRGYYQEPVLPQT